MSDSVARKFEREISNDERLSRRLVKMRRVIENKRHEQAQKAGLDQSPGRLPSKLQTLERADFFQAAEQGNTLKVKAHLDDGFPVNDQNPKTGETALHIAAACGAKGVIRALISTNECNFLLRDKQGRLPSEMAYLHGEDPVLARYLGMKEKQQAGAQGLKLSRRGPDDRDASMRRRGQP